ncbi:MAG: 30S ribosomal protein S16 [Bacteroidota bacterium]
MAVKIRLKRRGRKKLALYDIVVADARAPRDGRFIEKLGNYNPNTHPATTLIKSDKALQWLLNGAQPTNTARNILSKHGILLRKHLQVGVTKGAITQEEADKKWEAWQQSTQKQPTETANTSPQVPKKDPQPAKASPKAAAKSSSTSPAEQPQSTQAPDSPAQQPADPQEKGEISAPPVSKEELPSASGEKATTPKQATTTAEKSSADSPAKSTQDK